jgi:hypothetical protein
MSNAEILIEMFAVAVSDPTLAATATWQMRSLFAAQMGPKDPIDEIDAAFASYAAARAKCAPADLERN